MEKVGCLDPVYYKSFSNSFSALAGIAAVSLLTVTSRHKDYRATTMKRIKNSEEIYIGSSFSPLTSNGSLVVVQNLFGNLPVRRRLLTGPDKKRGVESTIASIKNSIVNIILSLGSDIVDINFRVDNRAIIAGSMKMQENTAVSIIRRVYGADIIDSYDTFEQVIGGIFVKGLLSLKLGRSKMHQYICMIFFLLMRFQADDSIDLNRRKLLLDDLQKDVNKQIENSMHDDSGIAAYPLYVLWITAPMSGYDMCQDPSKAIVNLEVCQTIHSRPEYKILIYQ